MQTYKCDRCGNYVDSGNPRTIKTDEFPSEYELCPKRYKKLLNFLATKEKTDE